MPTQKQSIAAQKNIKKAQATWKAMSKREHSLAQPQGRARKKPGTTGQGHYYHIEVRPKEKFVTFRIQDVGKHGHVERLAGKRTSGSWDTVSWLIGKEDAHVTKKGELILDSPGARTLYKQLGSKITHLKGDLFKAKPRPNVPEKDKPTKKQREAWTKNIKKAQKARGQGF